MNRYTRSQFIYSTMGKPVLVAGPIVLQQAVKASLVDQGVTLTAVAFGSGGNSITYQVTGGGTAGAEVVTVTGNAISVQVELTVSTITQVRTAINASVPAAALVLATGTSATTVDSASGPTNLAGGIDGVASSSLGSLVSSVARTGVGEYTITLADAYNSLAAANFQLLAATPVDLVPQMLSVDVVSAKTIVVNLLAGATPTEVAAAATLYADIVLNAGSQNS